MFALFQFYFLFFCWLLFAAAVSKMLSLGSLRGYPLLFAFSLKPMLELSLILVLANGSSVVSDNSFGWMQCQVEKENENTKSDIHTHTHKVFVTLLGCMFACLVQQLCSRIDSCCSINIVREHWMFDVLFRVELSSEAKNNGKRKGYFQLFIHWFVLWFVRSFIDFVVAWRLIKVKFAKKATTAAAADFKWMGMCPTLINNNRR